MAFDLGAMLKDVSNLDTNREQIEYISLDLIDSDENNFYQLSGIDQLADNIATCGLQQPIRVRLHPDQEGRYIIVSGHRRRAAVELLAADDPDRWQEIPCIVERDKTSPALQQLRLIYANSNTRTMTNAELSEQAVQVEKLLYQLKEEGYEFPGRMRDHVAEAVGASKTKLARLKVIREKLASAWQGCWERSEIGESVAYALAQMPKSWQTVIYSNWEDKAMSLYADNVSRFRTRFEKVVKLQCSHGLNICEHTVTMMQKNSKEPWIEPCSGCCFDCTSLQTCGSCCPQAVGKKKELKATAKAAQREAELRQKERDRPEAEFAKLVWQRVGIARKTCGATVEAVVKARGESSYYASWDDPKQERMESGEGKYGPGTTMPFGCNLTANDMMHVAAVANVLHCSVDYLLGRTDSPEMAESKPPVSYSDTWRIGEPEIPGDYILLLNCFGFKQVEVWKWDGGLWVDDTSVFDPDVDGEIVGWIPMPGENKSPLNNSCKTGMSPSGHCGAAAVCPETADCCLNCDKDDCNLRCGWTEE